MRANRGLVVGSVVAGVALAIGVGGVGYAATGGNFLLGGANSASRTSSLTSTAGEHAVGGGAHVTALTTDRLGEYYTFLVHSVPIACPVTALRSTYPRCRWSMSR